MGEAVSLGIHESQSRLWENQVGRSREFCIYLNSVLKDFFPGEPSLSDPNELWKHVNRVETSLIRTEADEVTYSQHIVIRMLLEIALVTGELSVSDLPGAWSDLYEKYLGIRPTDDKNGVLQDVHWYSGSIGYFPTYALGNLYNAMMMESARAALPNLPQQIERGEFSGLLGWLRENVHRHGMHYKGPVLIKNITGKDLSAGPFVDYLKRKFLG
jgi:carboxypeptidase Taq